MHIVSAISRTLNGGLPIRDYEPMSHLTPRWMFSEHLEVTHQTPTCDHVESP